MSSSKQKTNKQQQRKNMSTVFWGAAGTATIELTIPREKNEITTKTLEGCLVKKDANIGIFVQTNLIDQSGDIDKFERSKYLFYSPDSDFQGDVTEATLTYPEISKKRGQTHQEMTDCTVEDPLIIRVHGHLFLCCDSQLSQSKFLDEHCKKVRINQSLDCSKTFCGLGSEKNGQLVFTPFEMSQCQSSNGLYKIKECSVYEKLKDAGPLLLDDNKTAVGYFKKTNHDCRILVSTLGRNQGGSAEPLPSGTRVDGSPTDPATFPPGGFPSGQTPTPPPGGLPSGQTPTPLPGGLPSGQTPTPLPGGLLSGQTPTPPPGGLPSGQTPTPPPGGLPSGQTPTPLPGGLPSGQTPTPPSGGLPSGQTPTPLPGGLPSGQTPTPPSGGLPSGQTPTPPSGGLPSGQTPTPPPGGSSTDSTPTAPPDNQSGSTSVGGSYAADGVPLPTQQQVYLKDLFQKDAGILQDLGCYLDRQSLVIKNHQHLADLLNASPFIKAKCKSNTEHSPTLDLLQLSQVSILSVNELVTTLREMGNNNVPTILKDKFPENVRQQSIANVLNDHAQVFEEQVASELDKDVMLNWKKLGRRLKIKEDELNQIALGCNPAKRLLEDYAYPTLEQEKLKAGCFRQHITKMDRKDILDLLDTFGITQQDDGRSIKDVIKPDSERMWKLCLLLNKSVNGLVKDWKNLAHRWGIEHEVYSQFTPSARVSPTKILLEDWLIAERPKFTANALCSLLGEIQRNDAKEFLGNKLQEHFRSNVAQSTLVS